MYLSSHCRTHTGFQHPEDAVVGSTTSTSYPSTLNLPLPASSDDPSFYPGRDGRCFLSTLSLPLMIFQTSNTALLLLPRLSSPSLLLAEKPPQSLDHPAPHHFHLSKMAGSNQQAGFAGDSPFLPSPLDHPRLTSNTTDLQDVTTEQQAAETSLYLSMTSPEC